MEQSSKGLLVGSLITSTLGRVLLFLEDIE